MQHEADIHGSTVTCSRPNDNYNVLTLGKVQSIMQPPLLPKLPPKIVLTPLSPVLTALPVAVDQPYPQRQQPVPTHCQLDPYLQTMYFWPYPQSPNAVADEAVDLVNHHV